MSAPASIDPYQLWLGVEPAAGKPDHYRLLGLPRYEGDLQAIAAAADKAKAKVRSHKPGAYARQWAALLDELDTAKATLLTADRKSAYDARLAVNGSNDVDRGKPASLAAGLIGDSNPASAPNASPLPSALPPATSHLAAQLLGMGDDDLAAFEAKPLAPAAPVDVYDPFDPMAPVSFDDPPPEKIADSPAPPSPMESAPSPGLSAPIIRGPQIVLPDASPVFEETPAVSKEPPIDLSSPARRASAVMPMRRRRSTPGWMFTVAGVAAVVLLAGAAVYVLNSDELLDFSNTSVVDKSSDEDPATERLSTATANPPKTTSVVEIPASETPAEAISSAEMPAVEVPIEETSVSVTPIAEDPASETPPVEMPAEEPVEPATPLTTEEIASLAESLKAARAALVKHDVALAKGELDKAAPLARTPPYSQSYGQLAELVAKATDFWSAFDRGAANLKADQELTFGSTTVKVVEVKDGRLTYEVAGLKRTKALRDLPLGLSIAVAEKGMSDPKSAASIVIKAAPLAVQPIDAVASQARTLWKEAEKQGASVQGLLAAVEDKYEFAPGASPSGAPESSMPAGASAGLGKLLASTREALVEHEVERAVADMAKAERLLADSPAGDEEKAKFDRLRLLTDYLTQFWSVVGDSLAGLEVGEEILVRDMPVAVIAATRDSLEVRTAGESHRFTLGNMPAGLALALAKMRLNENDAATKMMSAALYAVQKDDSFHATARKLWDEAAAAGADVGDLPKVLDDRYD